MDLDILSTLQQSQLNCLQYLLSFKSGDALYTGEEDHSQLPNYSMITVLVKQPLALSRSVNNCSEGYQGYNCIPNKAYKPKEQIKPQPKPSAVTRRSIL